MSYFPYALGGAALGYAAARRGRGRRAPGRTVDWNPQDLPVLTQYEVSPRFDPGEPYIVVGSYNPLHADEDYTRVTFDPARGIGQVPFNENINYIGFTVWMTPADFLRLNPVRQVPSKVSRYLDDALERGESLGPPFIDVKMDDEQPGEAPMRCKSQATKVEEGCRRSSGEGLSLSRCLSM